MNKKTSKKTLIFGSILFLGGIILLGFIEYRNYLSRKDQKELIAQLITIDNTYNPQNNDKPVFISGLVQSESDLIDSELRIRIPALHAERRVEMYQYFESVTTRQEKRGSTGGTKEIKEYSYHTGWYGMVIDSEGFNNKNIKNPESFPYENEYPITSNNAFIGDYKLSPKVLEKGPVEFKSTDFFVFNEEQIQGVAVATERNAVSISESGRYLHIGTFDPERSSIGTVRISYSLVPSGEYSVIGKQNEKTIDEYVLSSGRVISHMHTGNVSVEKIMESAVQFSSIIFWVGRIFGILFLVSGVALIYRYRSA